MERSQTTKERERFEKTISEVIKINLKINDFWI